MEPKLKLASHRLVDHPRDHDTARRGQSFQPCGDVDPVTEDIVVLDDYVAKIDSDAEHDAAVLGRIRVALAHAVLTGDGRTHRVDNAGELREQPVAGGLDHASPVLGDARFNQFGKMGGQRCQCPFLVVPHQPRIARDVGGEDGGEAALDTLLDHGTGPLS